MPITFREEILLVSRESLSSGKPVVLHLMEGYAATGENYVFEQVNAASRYEGHLLAEWHLGYSFNPVDARRMSVFRRTIASSFWERSLRFLARKPLERPYLGLLNGFFFKEMKSRKALLIHAHFGMMGYKCLRLVATSNRPLIVTFYGVDGSQALRDPYWRPRIAKMLKRAARVVVLCDEVKQRLMDIGGDPSKIEVWDIGIPVLEYPYRFPRGLGDCSVTKFLIVARFVEKKGYPYLLEAFARLLKEAHPVSLTIAGHGPLKGQIEQDIEAHGLGGKVTLIDTVGRKDFFEIFRQLLNEHDIFVLPSVIASNGDDEGGPPVVIANAQAVGLPVISTPVGGITRAITHGETGFFVEPANVNSLADCMRHLVQNPQLLERVSLQARRHIEAHFDVDKQLARVQTIYDEVLDEVQS